MSRQPLRISIAWRPVESFLGGWTEASDPLSDPGVALDVVQTLGPLLGPMVARVEASGGAMRARRSLQADWLIDDDGRPNAVIRRPVWDHGRRSAEWARNKQLLDAWETCGSGEWMMFAAAHLPLPVGLLTSAAASCAARAVDLAGLPSADRFKLYLADASSGSRRGPPRVNELRAAEMRRDFGGITEFMAVQATEAAVWAVSSAAGDPSGSATGSAETASFAARAAISVGYAERALAAALGDAAGAEATAGAVRAALPTIGVLRAASSPPPRRARRRYR